MQTRIANQMNSLTEMMGVGTAIGESFKAVAWPAAWGGSCSSSPAWSGSLGLRPAARILQDICLHKEAAAMFLCSVSLWELTLRKFLQQKFRVRHGLTGGIAMNGLFPTHNLNLLASESHLLVMASEAEPRAINFPWSHQKPPTETTAVVGCGRDCVPDPG